MDEYDLIWIGVIALIIFTFGFIAGYAIKGCPVNLSCKDWWDWENQNFSSLFCNCTKTNSSIENQWYFKSYNITECESASDCANINNTAIGCKKIDCNWCCFKKYGMSTCTLMFCNYYQGD